MTINIEIGEIARIEDWNIIESSDSDCTAQKMSFRLRGQVYGHPKYADGVKITTSHISAVDGLLTLCKNRVYLMGQPSSQYLAMLQAQGLSFNADTPLLPLLTALKGSVLSSRISAR
jgi:hypothetical protein